MDQKSRRNVGRYYPSEAGKCLRQLYFAYKYPQKYGTKTLKIMEAGNQIHEFVNKVFSHYKTECKVLEKELPVIYEMDNLTISGRVDSLLFFDNKVHVVEVKSTSYISYRKEPISYHEDQLQMYLDMLGIEHGVLLYVDRNTLESKSFFITKNQDRIEELFSRIFTLHACLCENKIPDLDVNEAWQCKYCQYSNLCKMQEKEIQKEIAEKFK